jgi:hypothetical protein
VLGSCCKRPGPDDTCLGSYYASKYSNVIPPSFFMLAEWNFDDGEFLTARNGQRTKMPLLREGRMKNESVTTYICVVSVMPGRLYSALLATVFATFRFGSIIRREVRRQFFGNPRVDSGMCARDPKISAVRKTTVGEIEE